MNEFIFLNDGDGEDEAVLGATDVFGSLEEAVSECEHWVGEYPGMRFYDMHGERLVAIDHGDCRTFHFERTGTFFSGFEDLVRRAAQRQEIIQPEEEFSVEAALREMWEAEERFRKERRGCLGWLLPFRFKGKKPGL